MQASRARVVVSTAAIVTAALAFVATGVWNYRRLERLLDARLGDALVALARTVAIDVTIPDPDDDVELALTLDRLARARIESGAEMVVLVDVFGTIVAADPPSLGQAPYLVLDSAPLASALTGQAAYGPRYTVGGVDLKSAFAPVQDPLGDVIGAVGIEAPADFFGALRDVRLTHALGMGIGMALVVVMTAVMWRFWARSERSEHALWRSQHLAMVGQMTATMAHEVRNPLSIIKATAERIRRKYGDGGELFDFIPDEVDRLDRLTRWYLDFAKPEAGERVAVSLTEIARESLDRLRKEAEAADVRLVGPLGDAEATCTVDRDRVLQAVINVVMNALQATPAGGEVSITVSEARDRSRIEVTDNGEGVPPDVQSWIFEPFHTTKPQGSGLGLAVVRQVVTSHGGDVGIESAPGAGTIVWMEFPGNQGSSGK